jgi:hypothetical protein
VLLQERKFVSRQRADLAKLCANDSSDVADVRVLRFSRGSPIARHFVAQVETLDGVREVAHKVPPPQFAVGKDLETQLLLLRQYAQNVLILKRPQARWVGFVCPREEQVGGPQETAYVVGSKLYGHRLVFPGG